MSNLRVEYPGAKPPRTAESGRSGGTRRRRSSRIRRRGRKTTRRPSSGHPRPRKAALRPALLLRWLLLGPVLAVLPFLLLIRGGVFAYHRWALGDWYSLALSATAAALLVALYAWGASRRLGAGKRLRTFLTRMAVASAAASVLCALFYIAGANVKSREVRNEYAALHPLLRVGVSAVVLVDRDAVITDAGRTPDFYRRLGLPPNESSLHFRQPTGFVHALDLRTRDRSEWRNRAVELALRMMGFHTLRHVGTADHLHVSLRLAG